MSTREKGTQEERAQGVGDRFQQHTKYARDGRLGPRPGEITRPDAIKRYPDAPRIMLPDCSELLEASLWEALNRRRSVRRFSDEALTKRELSLLLWAAQGVTAHRGDAIFQDAPGELVEGAIRTRMFRTAPSAGALYPVETYLAVRQVAGVPVGIYHYAVGDHALERLKGGDVGEAVARAALDQGTASDAAVVLIWSAVFARSKWKYGQRAYRYVYLDAGHVAQNVALAAVALGLGSCQIAALYDDEANALLDLDGQEESVIYMTAVGRPL